MKNLLSLLGALALTATGSSAVIACSLAGNSGGIDANGQDDGTSGMKFKELIQTDENWDYTYENKEQYQKASEHYMQEAQSAYGVITGLLGDGVNDFQTLTLWVSFGDFYFQTVIWYAMESQWDLVRIDEFDGNYKYDEIDVDTLQQADYSKEWFLARNEVLTTFLSYYTGSAEDAKSTTGLYAGGMKTALETYKRAKEQQIAEANNKSNAKSTYPTLQDDLDFINNLTALWSERFDKINALQVKINDILIHWE